MTEKAVVYGSWKVRHAEPLSAADRRLVLCRLPDDTHLRRSIRVDLRRSLPVLARFDGEAWTEAADEHLEAHNLAAPTIPLAIVTRRRDERFDVHAFSHRIERHATLFLSMPGAPRAVAGGELLSALRTAFDARHIELLNFECFYHPVAREAGAARCWKVDGSAGYFDLGHRFHTAVAEGACEGLTLQLGPEIGYFNHRTVTCATLTAGDAEPDLLHAMAWNNRKKAGGHAPAWTFVHTRACLGGRDDVVIEPPADLAPDETPEVALAALARTAVARRPSIHENRMTVSCEATAGTTIFTVEFASIAVEHRPAAREALYVKISPLKSRHPLTSDAAARDYALVERHLLGFLDGLGLAHRPSPSWRVEAGATSQASRPRQFRIAVVGPSGSGKSTTACMLADAAAGRGRRSRIVKLAQPLYDLQGQFYRVAGRPILAGAQDQILMEGIARQLRAISPSALVDDFLGRLAGTTEEIILNDDLRDDVTDAPALRREGFLILRVYAPRELRCRRLSDRADVTVLHDSPLDQRIMRITPDVIVTNGADLAALRRQIDLVLEYLLPEEGLSPTPYLPTAATLHGAVP